ncbi:MAG TPA: GDYXXLXY domain-containing protein [Azospirillaceae bacterium]|nr:GDYXXLXY domain-containing protein [Azospirillaceae bacterium]
MRRVLALVLLLLPTLVLAGWIGTLVLGRSGEGIRVALVGVDPRDLLRGHYLVARFDLAGDQLRGEPCVCLTENGADPLRPNATPLDRCEVSAQCRWPLAEPAKPFRVYIPADRAPDYERLLREEKATFSVLVRPGASGKAAISDLLVELR